MVRSLYGNWKFPIYVAFDQAVTPDIYNEILYELGANGIRVMISVCDQGPRNEALAKALGITPSKYWIKHPYNSAWDVFFSYDFIHLFKSFRNHTLDKILVFGDGTEVSKNDFEDLLRICMSEISSGSHLNDKMLSCTGTERQNVSMAVKLLSEDTAHLFRQYFPDDGAKQMLADFIQLMHRGFKLFSSYELDNPDPFRCAIGLHYNTQLPILLEIKKMIGEIRFIPRPGKVKPSKVKPKAVSKSKGNRSTRKTKATSTQVKVKGSKSAAAKKSSKGKCLVLPLANILYCTVGKNQGIGMQSGVIHCKVL